MAQLSHDDILKLARLARLDISEEEVAYAQAEISEILHYVEILNDVNLDGLDPTYQVTGTQNVTRPDVVVPAVASPEELLKNAPSTQNGHIKVKRMIG